jgi:UDP-N-acetylmuramoylalanine--D-glutamate ligase
MICTSGSGAGTVEKCIPPTGSQVSVIGMARSGTAVAELLIEEGFRVLASDIAATEETKSAKESLERSGVEVWIGKHPLDRLIESAFAVVSPGVPENTPVMTALREKRVRVYSELEVASWYASSPIAAVTGTNGKTTTVEMLGHIARNAGLENRVCGNVGNPLSSVCRDMGRDGWLVTEVSSFQLRHIQHFCPDIAAILNITPDHMDRYESFGEYVEDKGRILSNMGKGNVVVYNKMDPDVRSLLPAFRGTLIPFSLEEPGDGVFLEGNQVMWKKAGTVEMLFEKSDVPIEGDHNLQNTMVAALIARLMGIQVSGIRDGIKDFIGLEHRLEVVEEVRGVRFVNDSKATNPGAVKVALLTFPGKIVLIAGGKEKGLDYSGLRDVVSSGVKCMVAMGECAGRLEDEFSGLVEVHVVKNMREAVIKAFEAAGRGGTVLLSPGTSSYDQYRDYEDRGRDFKTEVARLR